MNSYNVKRNSDGWVVENCPIIPGVKIGSFDCTANCKNNHTSKNEIRKHGFDIPEIICFKGELLPKENQQLKIEIP